MSQLSIACDIVGRQQFGAPPKRSSNELVSCVMHDIEEAKSQGWASTFVTLNVQGAFDTVLHNRLIWRMQAQRWPKTLLRWTSSFLKNRKIQVHFQGGATRLKELFCGVPQGSHISPLFFLLYIAEQMRSGNTISYFSYADDIGNIGFGRTIGKSAEVAQREVDGLTSWVEENAVSFNAKKSEVVQFSGPKKEEPVGVYVNGNMIELAEHIRWLGVHLDPRLNFKHHAAAWCGKALKVAQYMRRINSVMRGTTPNALITAVESCVIPVATFGARVWWPGMTRPAASRNIVPPTSHMCGLIDKAQHITLRATLPGWRTTPNVVLHREGGIPPARILLEGFRLRLVARLNPLDDRHLLRIRAYEFPKVGTLK